MISEESLYIEDGENLTKNELKSRLHQMEIEYDNSNQRKNYFVDLYNKAIKYTNNRKKIDMRLKKDTVENLERRKKRIRDTSEDASKVLNINNRTSKLDKREPANVENKIVTDLNFKKAPNNNFTLVEDKNPLVEEFKNFVMLNEKIEVKRNTINVTEFIPRRERESALNNVTEFIPERERDTALNNVTEFIPKRERETALNKVTEFIHKRERETALNNVTETISKIRNSEASAVIENKDNPPRKPGISTGKIVIKKISGANLMSLNLNSEASKANSTEHKTFQKFHPSIITEEVRGVNLDNSKKYSFGSEKFQIKSDNHINNEQILSTEPKIQIASGADLIFPNKRRTPLTSDSLSGFPMKLQTIAADAIENSSKINTPYQSLKKLIQHSTERLEETHNVKYVKPVEIGRMSENAHHEKEINERLNGAHLGEINNISINSIKLIPTVKKENGMNLSPIWKDEGPTGTSLKQLIKYFLAGVACSVIVSGIYYLIKLSPSINFEKKGEDNSYTTFPEASAKDTTTSRNYNLGADVGTEKHKIIDLENKKGPELFQTFNERLHEFFMPVSRIFEFIINPKKILHELIIEGVKYLAVDLAWGWIKNNVWTFALIFILKLMIIKAYHYARNRRNASKIFQTVKGRLKDIYDVDHIQNGISEEDIIREYSKEYNIKEDHFKTRLLPRIKELRRQDGEVKEFETYVHGRIRTVWQYLGY